MTETPTYTGVGIDANGRSFNVVGIGKNDAGNPTAIDLVDLRCILGVNNRQTDSRVWGQVRASASWRERLSLPLEACWTRLVHEEVSLPSICGNLSVQEASQAIAQAIVACAPESVMGAERTLAIPNLLTEAMQTEVLEALAIQGWVNTRLVWRPIAAALFYLNKMTGENVHEGLSLKIVDLDAAGCEVTSLDLKVHENCVVPVRYYPDRPDEHVVKDAQPWITLAGLIGQAETNETLVNGLLYGAYGEVLQRAVEAGTRQRVWLPAGHCWTPHYVERVSEEQLGRLRVGADPLGNRIQRILLSQSELGPNDVILCCGCLAKKAAWLKTMARKCKEVVFVDPGSIAIGTAIYSHRIACGLPTYLDSLPPYGLWLERSPRGFAHKWEFYPIIPPNTLVAGGKSFELEDPVRGIWIQEGKQEFPLILRRGAEPYCRQVPALLPEPLKQRHPVIIRVQMTPAGGNAHVSIESQGGELVFGKTASIELNWKRMEQVELPQQPEERQSYGYPFVVQTRGRLEDEPGIRQIMERLLCDMGECVSVSDLKKSLLEKNAHYLIPWGWRRLDPHSISRGMFGPHLTSDTDVLQLAHKLSVALINGFNENRAERASYARAFGFMYQYAPKTFVEWLVALIERQGVLERNYVIACGRVITTGQHAARFISRMIREGKYSGKETDKWWPWAFMRFLCYYPDTTDVPVELAENAMKWLCVGLEDMAKHEGPRDKDEDDYCKYSISAILFGLRFRENHGALFVKESHLFKTLQRVLLHKNLQRDFPSTMFRGGALKPKAGDNFNKFILRFLRHEESEEDRAAAGGLGAE